MRVGAVVDTPDTEAVCDCGGVWIGRLHNLRSGHTQSCGCLQREATTAIRTTHGEHGSPLYKSWTSMLNRCRHRSSYTRQGVQVCDEWQTYSIFRDWALNHGYAPGLHLDRIDNDGNYEPNNCQWLTSSEHYAKTARENAKLTEADVAEIRRRYAGGGVTQHELADEYGVSQTTIWERANNR